MKIKDSTKVKNHEIENLPIVKDFIKNRMIDIETLFIACNNECLLKDMKSKKREKRYLTISLKPIKDNDLASLIISTIYYSVIESKYYRYSSFMSNKIRGLLEFLSSDSRIYELKLNSFLKKISGREILEKEKKYSRKFIESIKYFYNLKCDSKYPFKYDVWHVENYYVRQDRINTSSSRKTFNFLKIDNEKNRQLLKVYCKYLVEDTTIAINSIIERYESINRFLQLSNNSIIDISESEVALVIMKLKNKYTYKPTLSSIMCSVLLFVDFLIINDYIDHNFFLKYKDLTKYKYQIKDNAPSEYIVNEIFMALSKFKRNFLVIWFLIIYCTGMRVSEATCIKRDCIQETNGKYFIIFYQQKMKKFVTNEIPKSLYEMIKEYREDMMVGQTNYLFPNRFNNNKPWTNDGLKSAFNKEINIIGLFDENGNSYKLTPHSFRHLIANRLNDLEAPLSIIQEQLHHESPSMTTVYIEQSDRRKVSNMKKFINNNGKEIGFEIDGIVYTSEEDAYSDYVSKKINAQVLPNGLCARPFAFGKCPYGNNCLKCSKFRTSIKYLPVLKEQRRKAKRFLEIAEQNKWEPQIVYNTESIEQLDKIINKLENSNDKEINKRRKQEKPISLQS